MDFVIPRSISSDRVDGSVADDRDHIGAVLYELTLNEKILLKKRPSQHHYLQQLLDFPFVDTAERRLFCLELFLLSQDQRFPVRWNKTNLEYLRQLHLPHLPVSGLEDLLIPTALREAQGRSVHPLLLEIGEHLDRLPETDLQWTLLLSLIGRSITVEEIADLFNAPGFALLDPPKLHTLLKFDLNQLRVLSFFLQRYRGDAGAKFDMLYFFVQHTTMATDDIETAGGLIKRFIWEVMPIAQRRCLEFGKSYFLSGREQNYGFHKAIELFYLWLLHLDHRYVDWFFTGALSLQRLDELGSETYAVFRELSFEQVITFLPDFCLWKIGQLAQQNKGVLVHLAAGKNIRSFPGLCLPLAKKVAHAFHQLRPEDLGPFTQLNDYIFKLYGRYLQVDERILRVVANYLPFVWIRLNRGSFLAGNGFGNRSRFAQWENILKKWAHWLRADPNYSNLSMEEIWQIFSYLQHLLDEQQDLALKGATIRSLQRRALNWRRDLAEGTAAGHGTATNWLGAKFNPRVVEQDGTVYKIVQLTNAQDLREEGKRMHHCVYNYRNHCAMGKCSIWSLRRMEGDREVSLVTMEINHRKQMVQAKGPCNQAPYKYHQDIIRAWAREEQICDKLAFF